MSSRRPVTVGVAFLVLLSGSVTFAQQARPSFEANLGQADEQTRFLARGEGFRLLLSSSDAVWLTPRSAASGSIEHRGVAGSARALQMSFVGADPSTQIEGLNALPGKTHYLVGRQPESWVTHVPTYSAVRYKDLYPGVDLIYRSEGSRLEFQFIIAPGVDPDIITLDLKGRALEVDPAGDLMVQTIGGHIRLQRPMIHQQAEDERLEIEGQHFLLESGGAGFGVGSHDAGRPLYIRVAVDGSAFFGSDIDETSREVGVAIDGDGNTFIAGSVGGSEHWSGVISDDAQAYEPAGPELHELADAFVIKLAADGSSVAYSTYFGGSGDDVPLDLVASADGQLTVAGWTGSSDFPTAHAVQGELSGASDAFLLRLNADGSGPVYSTMLGGDGADAATGIALDGSGNVWIAGQTGSSDFPTTPTAFQQEPSGATDAFVAQLASDGSALLYAGYFGGLEHDRAEAIAVGPLGDVYLTGSSSSEDLPITSYGPDGESGYIGAVDAFIARIDPSDGALAYSAYLGGSNDDVGQTITLDDVGDVFVAGWTRSPDFPATTQAMQGAPGGAVDGFLVKLSAADQSLVHSSYVGGRDDDRVSDILVGPDGSLWLAGTTGSFDFPMAGTQEPRHDRLDGFVFKLDFAGLAPVRSTYLGGDGDDRISAIALNPAGQAVVAGTTGSTESPHLRQVESTALSGDVFISVVPAATQLAGCPGTVNFDNDSGDLLWQTASNWDTDALPISTDDVCIGAFDVTLSSGTQTVQSLTVEAAGSLTLSSGTLSLSTASQIDGGFTQAGGTLTGAGDLTLTGAFDWTGGTQSGTGETNPQGGLSITGSSSKSLFRTINNTATTTYNSTGNWLMGTGAVFDNKSGAMFDVQNDSEPTFNGGSPAFINDGTFVKSGGTGTTDMTSSIVFVNDGVVDVQSGTLELSRGATHNGSFDCTGATLSFNGGTHDLSAAQTLTGTDVLFDSGTVNLAGGYDVTGTTTVAGGTANFTGSITDIGALSITSGTANLSNTEGVVTQPTFTMSAGTLTGSSDLTVTGPMQWTGGTLSGSGAVNPQGGLSITGNSSKSLFRTINNTATTSYNSTGNWFMGTGAVFDNKAGATFDVQNDAEPSFNGGSPVFINDGTFVKSGGTGTTDMTSSIVFTNDGVVDVQSGTLELNRGATHTGSFDCTGARLSFNGGTHNLSAAQTLTGTDVLFDSGTVNLPGGYNVTGTTTVAGGTANFTGSITDIGTLVITSGTANLSNTEGVVTQSTFTMSAGTLTGSSDLTVTGPMQWTGGTLSGSGAVNPQGGLSITGSSAKLLNRTLNNTATTTYATTGAFLMGTGAVFDNKAGATFDVQNDSEPSFNGGSPVFVNDGTFVKSGGTGTTAMTFSIVFTNGGAVDVQSGTLQLNRGATHTGSFDCTGARLSFNGGTHNLSAAQTLTGTDVLFDSGTVNLPGGYNVTGTTTVAGGTANFTGSITDIGTLSITSGTANLSNTEGVVTQSTFTMSAGTLTGSSDLTVTGPMQWTGGTLSGSGAVNPQGGLSITGSSAKLLNRMLNNTATTTYATTGAFLMGTGAVFDNKAGATFDVQNDSEPSFNGGSPVFVNDGTFVKSGGTGTTAMTFSIVFTNGGAVDVQSGTLQLNRGATHTGSFDCTGARLSFNGGTHNLSAAQTLTGTDVLFDSGTVNLAGGYDVTGTTTVAGGTANFTGSITDIGALSITSGTANLSNTEGVVTQSTFTMSAGTLTGSSDLTVTGPMQWTGGTLSGSGAVNPQGGLSITGSSAKLLNRTLNNTATTTYATTGAFLMGTGAVFDNKAGATFDVQNDSEPSFNGGSPVFVNDGTFVKSGGTGTTAMTFSIVFTNGGAVDVQSGTLQLNRGATHTGSFDCTGARLSFNGGTHNLSAAQTLTGTDVLFDSGTVNLPGGYNVTGTTTVAGSTANFTGSITSLGHLVISSGTANLSNTEDSVALALFTQSGGTLNGSSDVNLTGPAIWSGGTHGGTGVTDVLGGLTLSGSGSTILNRTMNNSAGAVLDGSGNFVLSSSGIFNNLVGGTFDVQTDADIVRLSGAPQFNNAGTFRKSAGAGTTHFSSALPFTNTGAVEALAGTLTIAAFTQTAGSTTVNGGLLTSNNDLDILGGTVTGVGTVSTPTVDSTAGQVAPGLSTGVLTFDGDYNQQAAGSFRVELGGVGCTESDRLDVTGTATVDGTLDVTLIDGCHPTPGQSFTLITAGSVLGPFANFTPPATNCPVDWNIVYNPGSVVLEILTGTCLDGDGDNFSDCCGTCAPDVGDACTDCDDADPVSFPGAPELCDGTDNDCDTVLPGNEIDDDGDLYVECTGWNDTQGNAPTILGGDDCDDADSTSFPGSPEVCDGNDNDCDTVVPVGEIDDDGDSYVDCTGWDDTQGDQPTILGGADCDDADAASSPGASEVCDGNDNDCDTIVPADEADDDLDLYVECSGWSDTQGDQPAILGGADCDDLDVTSFPGGAEVCDGNDNDCDTVVPADEVDTDGDFYVQCIGWDDTQGDQPAILGGNDCAPGDALINPGAIEICDGNDNDCSGDEDDGDTDADGFLVCADCDDGNDLIHAIPTAARNLRFLESGDLLWDPPLDPGGSVVDYDTIRSSDPADFVNAAVCVESDDGADTAATDLDEPGSAGVFYYLARAENDCGVGSVGTSSDGQERVARLCP